MTKHMYRFVLRTMIEPREAITFESGPFTHMEAMEHAQAAAVKRALATGAPWTYDFKPIVEAVPVPNDSWNQYVFIVAALVVAAIVLTWWRFQ